MSRAAIVTFRTKIICGLLLSVFSNTAGAQPTSTQSSSAAASVRTSSAQAVQPAQTSVARGPEFVCTSADPQASLPATVKFRIVTSAEIEARAIDKNGKESPVSLLRRNDVPNQPRAAAFSMSGQLGVSGDARLLIARSALDLREVGIVMISNESTRDLLSYQCSR